MRKIYALAGFLAVLLLFASCLETRDVTYHNAFLGVSVFKPGMVKADFVVVENVNETGEPIVLDELRFSDDGVSIEILQLSQSAGKDFADNAWVHVSGRWLPDCGTDISAAADYIRVPSDARDDIAFALVTDESVDIDGRAYYKLVYEMQVTGSEAVLPMEILITRGVTEGSFVIVELNHGGTETTHEMAEVMRGYVTLTPLHE